MFGNKKSFFDKLTGHGDDEEGFFEEAEKIGADAVKPSSKEDGWMEEENGGGQLTVDVYQTPEDVIVQTMIAGVKPDDLDVDITRDMVTIKGQRESSHSVKEDNYFHKELYWGVFSRTVLLPQEIDPEMAEATEKHGLLTIRLPKLNKDKTHKVRVKSV